MFIENVDNLMYAFNDVMFNNILVNLEIIVFK